MNNHLDQFWRLRLAKCRKALENNRFRVFTAETPVDARRVIIEKILPELDVGSASWGDSVTLHASGILDDLRRAPGIDLIETFDPAVNRETLIERRRQALLVDLFLTGTNALTDAGQLVNLDMIGNRTSAITFGPRNVIVLVGRNKIVTTLEAAMDRIRRYAAPLNAIRHEGFITPCRKTAKCHNCKSPQRICNSWSIIEKSYPEGRITVILINEDLGL